MEAVLNTMKKLPPMLDGDDDVDDDMEVMSTTETEVSSTTSMSIVSESVSKRDLHVLSLNVAVLFLYEPATSL